MEQFQPGASFKKPRFYNIDFLKFLFAIIIVYYHFSDWAVNTIINMDYIKLRMFCDSAFQCVECFFIISGFFLFSGFTKNKEKTLPCFIKEKIARLWPILALFFILNAIISKGTGVYTDIINMFFLQNIGITTDSGTNFSLFNWYISAYFWISILYFYILKTFQEKYANLIIALCTYFSLVAFVNSSAIMHSFNTFFNMGVLRACAGIGLGYFLGIFYQKIKDKLNNFSDLKGFTVFSAIEIICFKFLIQNFLYNQHHFQNKIIYMVAFMGLFFAFLFNKGVISKIFNNKFFAFFGKFSYSIYAMQGIAFAILHKTIFKDIALIKNVPFCLSVSMISVIILGIIAYYLVEKPCSKYLKEKFKV